MTALSIYAQAHRPKEDSEPLAVPHEKGAYVATFAERRAVYKRAAQLRHVQAVVEPQPTQAETASQTAVSTPSQASTSSVSASIPPKTQPKAPGAAVPVNAIAPAPAPAPASAPACDRVQPRYADSPPFSTAATVESSNALAKARATKGAGFQLRVHPAEVWNALSGMYAKQNGCDRATALKDLGFVHPAISVAISRR